MRLLTLSLGERTFGVDVNTVREVASIGMCTRAWGAPDFVDGLVNLRGEVMTVISLGALLRLPAGREGTEGCLVVLRGDTASIALRMDAVIDAVEVNDEELHPPPENLGEQALQFTLGMCQAGKDLVCVLDAEAIVNTGRTAE